MDLFSLVQNPISCLILNGSFGIEMFFYTSSFLGFHRLNTQCELENGGQLSLRIAVSFVMKRILTMVPVYFLLLLFAWLIVPLLGEGPAWFQYRNLFFTCD